MFRGTTNGYDDTTSEFKYYLEVSGGNFTDNHVTTTSIEDSTLPPMYLFVEGTGSTATMWFKVNGAYVAGSKVYKKVNGAYVEQTDLTQVFDPNTNYVMEV